MATTRRRLLNAAKWALIATGGLLGVAIVLGIAGYGPQAPRTDISAQRPYADYIGREYRIAGEVSACAWNDFPNKDKILVITLPPSLCAANRFVSYRVAIAPGKRIQIVRAWRSYHLFESRQEYVVSVADAGLPPNVEVTVEIGDDGVLDRRFYESVAD